MDDKKLKYKPYQNLIIIIGVFDFSLAVILASFLGITFSKYTNSTEIWSEILLVLWTIFSIVLVICFFCSVKNLNSNGDPDRKKAFSQYIELMIVFLITFFISLLMVCLAFLLLPEKNLENNVELKNSIISLQTLTILLSFWTLLSLAFLLLIELEIKKVESSNETIKENDKKPKILDNFSQAITILLSFSFVLITLLTIDKKHLLDNDWVISITVVISMFILIFFCLNLIISRYHLKKVEEIRMEKVKEK